MELGHSSRYSAGILGTSGELSVCMVLGGGREEGQEVEPEEVVEQEYKDDDVIMEGKARGRAAKDESRSRSSWYSWKLRGGR